MKRINIQKCQSIVLITALGLAQVYCAEGQVDSSSVDAESSSVTVDEDATMDTAEAAMDVEELEVDGVAEGEGDVSGDDLDTDLADQPEPPPPPTPSGEDSDGDGISDVDEAVVGTDPLDPDSDGDGLVDGVELQGGTHPLREDSDEDGVSDPDEVAQGTDPVRPDTDGDGFTDGEERTASTDPLDPFNWAFGGGRWPDMTGLSDGSYPTGYGVGDIMVDVAGVDQLGDLIHLYQFYGYVVLLDFSAGWCQPCRETAADAQAMWEAYRDDGLMIIHLLIEGNVNGSEATAGLQAEWAAQYDIEFPVIRETSNPTYGRFLIEDLYPGSLPFLVLLDREMRLDSGYGAGAEAAIMARLETLLADEPKEAPWSSTGASADDPMGSICDTDADGALRYGCGGDDCDDGDAARSPAAAEQCTPIDQNCDGLVHAQAVDAMSLYLDSDGDGYGTPLVTKQSCALQWQYVDNAADCDDADAELNPETLWYRDADGDGLGDPNISMAACEPPEGFVANNQDSDDGDGTSLGCWERVTVGRDHSCGLKTDGTVVCWGSDAAGKLDAPSTSGFVDINAGYNHTCALDNMGMVTCWGSNSYGASTPPEAGFTTLSCGLNFCCGLTGDPENNIRCWGQDDDGQATPPSGLFTHVSAAGGRHACALDLTGAAVCWGKPGGFQGGASPLVEPEPVGVYTDLSAAHYYTCGLLEGGEVRCWGSLSQGQDAPPPGLSFQQILGATVHACGLTTQSAVACWGSSSFGRTDAPEGTFTQFDVNQLHSCAVDTGGLIQCWGYDEFDKLSPPTCTP